MDLLAPELEAALSRGSLEIDGSSIERIGQAGLQLLLSARCSAERLGVPFAISAPSQPLCRAAQIAGLSEVLSLPDAA